MRDTFDRETLNRLYRYCMCLCEHEADAFDLLQSGVERCLRSPPTGAGDGVRYAMRIMRNLFIDEQRRKAIVVFEPLPDEDGPVDVDLATLEDVIIDRERLAVLWKSLKPIEREILFFWAVEGLSTTEVAEQLGKPRNSILSIIHRMRQRIRESPVAARVAG